MGLVDEDDEEEETPPRPRLERNPPGEIERLLMETASLDPALMLLLGLELG